MYIACRVHTTLPTSDNHCMVSPTAGQAAAVAAAARNNGSH